MLLIFFFIIILFTGCWLSPGHGFGGPLLSLKPLGIYWYEGHGGRRFDLLKKRSIHAIAHPSVDGPPPELQVLQGGEKCETCNGPAYT